MNTPQSINRLLTNFILLSIFGLSSICLKAQLALNWAQNLYPTPIYSYTGRSIILDESGNIYTCGAFAGTADMDPGPGIYNLATAGYSDIFIRKQNAAGDLIWAKRIGGSQNDLPSSICMDEHHQLYITGLFTNTVDFDPGPGSAPLATGSVANSDIFILKLDSTGNYKWSCGMGSTTFQDYGTSVASDQHGHIIVGGYFRESVDFDPSPAVFSLTSTGSPNIFVLALDTNKNFQWAYANLTTAFNISPMIVTNHLQEVYVAGSFTGSHDFDPGASSVILSSVGNDDIFFQKFNSLGQLIWAKSIGGIGNDKLGDIRIDPIGNIYASGSFQNTMDADPNSAVSNLSSSGNDDVFILKWDANANLQFAKSFGGTSQDRSNGMYVDSAKNIFLTGYFSGSMDMNPGTAILNASTNGLTDGFVSKFDANGQFVWGRTIGAYDFDYGYAITGNDSGHIIGLGVYRGQADLDPAVTVFCPDTNLSTYLFKWDQCHVDTQVNQIGGTLTANMPGAQYQWLNCMGSSYTTIPGSSNQSFTPLTGGDYALQISQGNCVDTSACIKVSIVGIQEAMRQHEVFIYPNPSNDFVKIHGLSSGVIQIKDISGRICFNKKFAFEPIIFSVNPLPRGIYFLEIQNGLQEKTLKLMKE